MEEWKACFLTEHAERQRQSLKEIQEQQRQLSWYQFSVGFEDGAHYNELDTFDTLEVCKQVST